MCCCGRWKGERKKVVIKRIVAKRKHDSNKHSTGSGEPQHVEQPSLENRPDMPDSGTMNESGAKSDRLMKGPAEPPAPQAMSRMDSVETVGDTSSEREYYTGGVSQWREEAEDRWCEWDWPPHGWQPSSWHDAYWNTASPWYKYNHKEWKWDTNTIQCTPGPTKQPEGHSPPSTLRSSTSSASLEVEGVAEMLRSSTGDIVPVPQAAGTVPPENGGKVGDESMQKGKGETPPSADGHDTTQNGQSGGDNPGTKKSEDGKADTDTKDIPSEDAKAAELEKKRKAAHARYMRYYRNIRSVGLNLLLCVVRFDSQ